MPHSQRNNAAEKKEGKCVVLLHLASNTRSHSLGNLFLHTVSLRSSHATRFWSKDRCIISTYPFFASVSPQGFLHSVSWFFYFSLRSPLLAANEFTISQPHCPHSCSYIPSNEVQIFVAAKATLESPLTHYALPKERRTTVSRSHDTRWHASVAALSGEWVFRTAHDKEFCSRKQKKSWK